MNDADSSKTDRPEADLPTTPTRRGTHGCGPLILDFRKLAQNRNEFFIQLDGETYRLQLTRNNKLILTK